MADELSLDSVADECFAKLEEAGGDLGTGSRLLN